jgi:hypothetical protein
MPVRDLIGSGFRVLGSAKVTINTATTTAFDFGTPNDIKLAAASGAPGNGYKPGDRLVAIFDASTAGTTDTVSFSVQDANDASGSFGTAATAKTDGTGAAGGTGDRYAVVGIRVQAGRPWIRCRVTSTGATDTFVAQCYVLAIPREL